MKSIVTLTFMLSTMFAPYEQDIPESQVPSVVKNTFLTYFSNTTDVEWEKEKDLYVVDFEINSIDHKAYINPAGKLLKIKSDVAINELPEVVTTAIAKDHPGYTIDDADKILEAGKSTYILELEKGLVEYKAVYSAEGKLLQKNAGMN